MRLPSSVALVGLAGILTANSAFAQQQTTARQPLQGGYVAAMGGAVSGPPTEAVFSVEYADDVNTHSQAYVTLSYFENLMRQDLRDELTTLGVRLATLTGERWEFAGRDRAVTLTAGGKYLAGNPAAAVRPYVGGGAGLINVRRTIVEARLGTVGTAVFNDFGIGATDLSRSSTSLNRPLVEAVAGVGFVNGHTYVDVAYRYRRAFRLADSLDFSQFTAGIGYRF